MGAEEVVPQHGEHRQHQQQDGYDLQHGGHGLQELAHEP